MLIINNVSGRYLVMVSFGGRWGVIIFSWQGGKVCGDWGELKQVWVTGDPGGAGECMSR